MKFNPVSIVLRAAIRAYQLFISPILPGSCRYSPSCSDYAIQAISRHGPLKGAGLGLFRIARCQPWGGGYDPVPEKQRPDASGIASGRSCSHDRPAANGQANSSKV